MNLKLSLVSVCLLSLFVVGHFSKLFYIYETDDWPAVANASLAKRDVNERLENMLNNGAGPVVNVSQGAYHTDQYQLFSMIYYRALKDPRRTLDPSKATSFIIPYDFASDSAFYKNCARSAGVCYDFRKCPLASRVEQLLAKSKWFQRKEGRDHLLVVGMNYAMDHYILKPKCKSLLLTCTNCTKFAIDDYSFMYSGDAGILARGDYWHAIPFPADFHWSKHTKTPYPWENTDRPITVSYIGSDKSFYGPAKRLRSSIIHYCGLHTEDCYHLTYGLNGTRHSHHVFGYDPLKVAQKSVFCFQPIGDLMTRKGLFDSLLQGCIPVVFDPLTASSMYTWHWEESFWKEISVELPFHGVAHRYVDPVTLLVQMLKNDSEGVKRKLDLIKSRVFELQYGHDGRINQYLTGSALPYLTLQENHTAAAAASGSGSSGATDVIYHIHSTSGTEDLSSQWPSAAAAAGSGKGFMRDAYDISMDLLLGWHSGELVRFRNASVPECWDGYLDKKANKCMPGKEPGTK